MLRKNRVRRGFAGTALAVVAVAEVAAFCGCYYYYRRLNRSQEYRYWMYQNFRPGLEAYYRTGEVFEVEGDGGRPQHEQHLDLLDKFSHCKRQLEQLLNTSDLAQLDEKLQELQAIITEVASHLPAASLRWVQEQFATQRSQVDEVREQLKPRKRFAFMLARGSKAPTGSDARLEGKCEPGPSLPAVTVKNACTMGFQGRSGETLMLSEVGGKDTKLDSLDDCPSDCSRLSSHTVCS
ncbi:hypothetical protein MTO96_020890 [Rhipicephalus appendiculatus]